MLNRNYLLQISFLLIINNVSTNTDFQGLINDNDYEDGYNLLMETSTFRSTSNYNAIQSPWHEPYFDASNEYNVTAIVGKSAYLSCKVRNIGNKTVSWIRHKDLHILTTGNYTYTTDVRFQATHHNDTDDWTLQLKWPRGIDSGIYECQISTEPVKSIFVNLNVVVPTATIEGGIELHFDKGSTINLTCVVRLCLEPPTHIFWFHQEDVISYDSPRGGITIITEKGETSYSTLLIQNAGLADSGTYTCAPSNTDGAVIRIHVLNGEHPEAMQTSDAAQSVRIGRYEHKYKIGQDSNIINIEFFYNYGYSKIYIFVIIQLILFHMVYDQIILYLYFGGNDDEVVDEEQEGDEEHDHDNDISEHDHDDNDVDHEDGDNDNDDDDDDNNGDIEMEYILELLS